MDSEWIIILVVIAAISLAVAPIYWMRPSPRQRQLVRLREHALQLGLHPELRATPAGLRHAGCGDKLMKYQWHRPEGSWPRHGDNWLAVKQGTGETNTFFFAPAEGYQSGPDVLLAELQGPVPESLYAIEADPSGIGFYWHESGDNSRVDELYRLLRPWVDTYRAQYLPQDQ
jgi:hypothetical protein